MALLPAIPGFMLRAMIGLASSFSSILMIDTIELTSRDTLYSSLARLKLARCKRVLFVVPDGLTLSSLDLAILRKEARTRGVSLALVTSDPKVRTAAGQAGISTYRTVERAEQVPDWRDLRVRLQEIVARPTRLDLMSPTGPAEVDPPPGPGLYGRQSPTGFEPSVFLRSFVRHQDPQWNTTGLALVLLFLSFGLLYALSSIVPEARVTVVPASEPIAATVSLRAVVGQDAQSDIEAGIVPASGISVQVSGEGRIATTGHRFEPSAKARGQVVFVNRTGRAVAVPAGTIVSTATGNNMRFSTLTDSQLDPGGRATVSVEAVESGTSGNVRAGTITQVEGPLSSFVVVSNEQATSGGGASEVSMVTDEDKQKLQAQVYEQLKQKAFEKLNERLTPGSFIPSESVSYLAMSPTFTPFVGDASPDLSLSMSVQATGLMVDTSDGNEVALDRLQRAMPLGSRLVANSVRYIPGSVVVENEKTIAFNITAQGTLLRGVDTSEARRAIAGFRPDKAIDALESRFSLATQPEIRLGPDWLPLIVPVEVPTVPWRIRLIVDWDRAAEIAQGAT